MSIINFGKVRVIEVVDYRPQWVADFVNEKAAIGQHFNSVNIASIHHIGSTSVKGLCAKPIIDILVEVYDLDTLDAQAANIELLGYEVKGEFGISGRRYFQKGGIQRTHQIHAFKVGSPGVERHLAFRDYLIAFPKIMLEYGAIKKEGVKLCNNNIEKYVAHKNHFIQFHEQQALNYFSL